jgi:plasmid maintenance system antidote protein VapI
MKNPPHPGRIVGKRSSLWASASLRQPRQLGVKRQTLNNLVNGKVNLPGDVDTPV